jgi:hypothetical protein
VIVNCRKIVALNITDGSVAWVVNPFLRLSTLNESGDLLCGLMYKAYGAVDLVAQDLRFVVEDAHFMVAPPPVPTFLSSESARAIVVDDEILLVNPSSRRLWGLDAATGKPRWMQSPAGGITGLCPVYADGRLIVQGPELYCFVRGST